jgi:hypothetical protein
MCGGVKFIPLNKESLSLSALDAVQGSNRSFFSGIHPENRNILCWQNVNCLNVKLGDKR